MIALIYKQSIQVSKKRFQKNLFQTNHVDDNHMESFLRHFYVKSPKEFEKDTEGDESIVL